MRVPPPPTDFIAIGYDEKLGENVRSLTRRIVVDANARCFSVETLTGEPFEYWEDEKESFFRFPENFVPFPEKKAA